MDGALDRRSFLRMGAAGSAVGLTACLDLPADEPGREHPAAAEWSTFNHDPANTGYTHEPGPGETATIEWVVDAGTPTMNSSPVVVDGVVYATGTGDPGGLLAADAETGAVRWRAETDGYASGAPLVADDTVFVGTWNGSLHAFDRRDGDERWQVEFDHRIGNAAPTLADGTLYVATLGWGPLVVTGPEDEEKYEAPALLALDPSDGRERWRYDAFDDKESIYSSPAVADGRVVFTVDGTVHAVDGDAGELLWQRSTGSHDDLAPAIADDLVLCGGLDDDGAAVLALTADAGDVRWRTGIEEVGFRASPAVADGMVFVAATYRKLCPPAGGRESDCETEAWGRLYALGLDAGEERWRAEIEPDTRSAPAVTAEMVYVGCGDGFLGVSRAGEPRFTLSFEHRRDDDRGDPYVKSAPAVAGGRAFVGASDGHLRAIGPGSTDAGGG